MPCFFMKPLSSYNYFTLSICLSVSYVFLFTHLVIFRSPLQVYLIDVVVVVAAAVPSDLLPV